MLRKYNQPGWLDTIYLNNKNFEVLLNIIMDVNAGHKSIFWRITEAIYIYRERERASVIYIRYNDNKIY